MSDVEELEPSTSEEVDEELGEATEETPEEEIKLDRPTKNVIAEITRKNNEQMQQMMSQMTASFAEAVQGMQNVQKPSEPVEQKTGLNAYTIDQLEQHAAGLEETDPMRQKISVHVSDRKISDAVAQQVGAFTQEQKIQNARREWAEKATAKYPELTDEKSDFWGKVDRELKTMDPKIVQMNPRAAYDAANAVAAAEGVKPASRRQAVPKPGATKGGAKPVEQPEGQVLSDADVKKRGEGLAHALPKGKTFNADRIRERQKHYSANLNHHLKG